MTNARAPIPVLTIGGYLGSGKTTLVNHLLRNADGRRLAILVNEFGDLPIDEDLIEAEDDSLISIAGGCICCSFGNDLIGALTTMTQMCPPPDTVIIESSGVAIPGAIVASLSLLPVLVSDGIAVVVDAETVRKAASDDYIGDTILRQLSDAECIVVNKLDLVSEKTAQDVADWLNETAPAAIQIPAQHGQVLPEALLGLVTSPGSGRNAQHSDSLFESLILIPTVPVNAETLAMSLTKRNLGVIRSKGFVSDADGQPWLIQTVGERWTVQRTGDMPTSGVICLGFQGRLDRDLLSKEVGLIRG